jgi:hypothetical protein
MVSGDLLQAKMLNEEEARRCREVWERLARASDRYDDYLHYIGMVYAADTILNDGDHLRDPTKRIPFGPRSRQGPTGGPT